MKGDEIEIGFFLNTSGNTETDAVKMYWERDTTGRFIHPIKEIIERSGIKNVKLLEYTGFLCDSPLCNHCGLPIFMFQKRDEIKQRFIQKRFLKFAESGYCERCHLAGDVNKKETAAIYGKFYNPTFLKDGEIELINKRLDQAFYNKRYHAFSPLFLFQLREEFLLNEDFENISIINPLLELGFAEKVKSKVLVSPTFKEALLSKDKFNVVVEELKDNFHKESKLLNSGLISGEKYNLLSELIHGKNQNLLRENPVVKPILHQLNSEGYILILPEEVIVKKDIIQQMKLSMHQRKKGILPPILDKKKITAWDVLKSQDNNVFPNYPLRKVIGEHTNLILDKFYSELIVDFLITDKYLIPESIVIRMKDYSMDEVLKIKTFGKLHGVEVRDYYEIVFKDKPLKKIHPS